MKLFDFHCDIAYKLLSRDQRLAHNNLHVSLDKADVFENYAQVTACFQSHALSDSDAWNRFFLMSENIKKEVDDNADRVTYVTDGASISDAWKCKRAAFILSVEDARILCSDLSRLDLLYKRGVRILTLLWSGETCIGGSHDTDSGLTSFGRDVVKRAFELGITVDVSHASAASADDVASLAAQYGKPFIASHSCSYSVYAHTRNLRDRHIDAIIASGGLIGMSLCRSHICPDSADLDKTMCHIDYYLSHGARDVLCLGCDLDGTDLPDGFNDIRDLKLIEDELRLRGHSEDTIEKIFWKNALAYAERNIKATS